MESAQLKLGLFGKFNPRSLSWPSIIPANRRNDSISTKPSSAPSTDGNSVLPFVLVAGGCVAGYLIYIEVIIPYRALKKLKTMEKTLKQLRQKSEGKFLQVGKLKERRAAMGRRQSEGLDSCILREERKAASAQEEAQDFHRAFCAEIVSYQSSFGSTGDAAFDARLQEYLMWGEG